MKKLLSIVLCFWMLAATQIPAFAAKGFVKSPTANATPQVIESSNVAGNSYQVVLHSYGEREALQADQKINMENAYQSIKGADRLTDLNEDLKTIAKDKNIKEENLSVSDLFHVGYQDANGNAVESNGTYKIKLEAATLKNFVGLLYFDGNKWITVEGAKIDENGYLEFTTDQQGAFAVVVDTTKAIDVPKTGANVYVGAFLTVAIVSGVACAILLVKSHKNKKESA